MKNLIYTIENEFYSFTNNFWFLFKKLIEIWNQIWGDNVNYLIKIYRFRICKKIK